MTKLTLRDVDHYAHFLPRVGGDIGAYVAREVSPRFLPESTERTRSNERPRFTREEIGRGVGYGTSYVVQNGTLAGLVASTHIPVISDVGALVVFAGPALLHLYYKSKRR